MRKYKAVLQSPRFFAAVLAFTGIAFLGGTVWSSSSKSKKSDIKVNNHTQTLKVISAETHDGHVKMLLRNDSNKNVTAFVVSSVSSGSVFAVTQEFAYSESDLVIAAGSVYEFVFSISRDSFNDPRNPSVDLSAVIFEDKSSEGDPRIAQEIEYERLGGKAQFSRAIPVLEKMLALSDKSMLAYFDKDLKSDLETALNSPAHELQTRLKGLRPLSMNQQEADKLSGQIRSGLEHGKEYLLRKLNDLEERKMQGGSVPREEIVGLKTMCEKIIARL